MSPSASLRPLAAVLLLAAGTQLASAQATYRQPPAAVAQILDAPATPTALLSPDRARIVLLERPGLPSITEIAAPEYRVAGIRLNPRTSGPSRQSPSRAMSTTIRPTSASSAVTP